MGILEEYHTMMNALKKIRNEFGIMRKKVDYECPGIPMDERRISPKQCSGGTGSNDGQSQLSPLNLKHYNRLFLLYGIGIGMSILAIILEIAIPPNKSLVLITI